MSLFLCDLDGTLIESYMARGAATRDFAAVTLLPGRLERLDQLRAAGHTLAIITNQGGVAFGYTTELEASEKLARASIATGIHAVYVCYADVRGIAPYNDPAQAARRKPSGAMIREAMLDHAGAAADGVLYIGDRPEDEAAAKDAGVSFQWADQFFS